MTKTVAILTEAVFVGAIGAATGGVLFSHWFLTCCRPLVIGWFGSLFVPGVLIAMFLGGGAGRATIVHAALGVAIELVVIWATIRWAFSRLRGVT